jgi:hypothetical protein
MNFVYKTYHVGERTVLRNGGAIGPQEYYNFLLFCAHCATNQKIAGSIPDGVTGIFHWHNASGRNMALGLTQPLTEMSTRNTAWG